MKNILFFLAILFSMATSAQTQTIKIPKEVIPPATKPDTAQVRGRNLVVTNLPYKAPSVVTNKLPIVKTGPDLVVNATTSAVLNGSGSFDSDGTIINYIWTQDNGIPVTFTPNGSSSTIAGLKNGDYRFRLTITDNDGGTSADTLHLTAKGIGVTPPPPPPPPVGYVLTFSSGYDSQADMLYKGNGQYGNGIISTTTYKTGPGSFYSRPAVVSSGTRSEVQYTETAQNPTEGAIEYDVMYEVIIPNNGCSIQWHPNTGGSSGSPYLMHESGKFTWVVWSKGGNNDYYPTGHTIKTDHWYHMRVEYKFGTPGQGAYLRHYIDGVKILDKPNIQLGDGSGQYLKVGYNGWDANSSSGRIYYDNLKIYKKS